MDLQRAAVTRDDFVGHVGRSLHEIHVGLAFEPLLDDLHVQQAQKSAAEAEAECVARFRLELKTGVVDRELFQGVAQLGSQLVLVVADAVLAVVGLILQEALEVGPAGLVQLAQLHQLAQHRGRDPVGRGQPQAGRLPVGAAPGDLAALGLDPLRGDGVARLVLALGLDLAADVAV